MLAISTNSASELAQRDAGWIASNRLRADYIHFTPLGYGIAGTNIANFASHLFFPPATLNRGIRGPYWAAPAVTNGQTGVSLGGTFTGNGSGLAGIPAASITGALTTNLANGAYTLYITNGLIWRVSYP